MSSAPGTVVNVTSASPANNTPAATGVFFAIGQTKRGAVGVPVQVTSMSQFIALFGTRTFNGATQQLFDAMTVFFQEGGSRAYISRVSGTSGVIASLTLKDKSTTPGVNTLVVKALGPGTWGNSITVQVATGSASNSFVLTIRNGTVTETSPNLFNPAAAVSWAATFSKTVTITNSGSVTAAPNNNPKTLSATALASGADTTSPADSIWVTALTAFPAPLGPGQVAAPGRTTATVWEGLVNHGKVNNRLALLDAANGATPSTIVSSAGTVQTATTDPSYGFMLAPWPIYPGLATNTATTPYPRAVAPSGAVAALMARNDAVNNCDVAAAGPNGVLRNAQNISQTFTPTQRASLDAAGVGVIRLYRGQVQLYGYTSMSIVPTWTDLANVRLRMQITHGSRLIADGYEFADIDARGHTASALGGQLSAYLLNLYNQGALYGTTAAQAFTVNTGSQVNTPTTAAARQLIADELVRMSPTAEQVIINITRYPVTQGLPS